MSERRMKFTPIRLPESFVERAERLIEVIGRDPESAALVGRVTRSAVLRLAVEHGLSKLEAEHGLERVD